MKQYLLSVVAAAIICGIVVKLMGSKGTQGTVGKLIAGLFLAFTIIAPLRQVRIGNWGTLTDAYSAAAQAAATDGKEQTHQALSESIKLGCEAYILDKAQQLDVDLKVEVTVSQDEIPVPVSVILKGDVSPASKSKLTNLIAEELDIPKEDQKWS